MPNPNPSNRYKQVNGVRIQLTNEEEADRVTDEGLFIADATAFALAKSDLKDRQDLIRIKLGLTSVEWDDMELMNSTSNRRSS